VRPKVVQGRNPKIKVVHILSRPDDPREAYSISSVSGLAAQGFEYKQRVFPPFTGVPPADTCATPQYISDKSGYLNGRKVRWTLSPGTYGCHTSHRKVAEEDFHGCDFLMVCECDCMLRLEPDRFAAAVRRFGPLAEEKGLAVLAIGAFTDPGGDVYEGIAPCTRIVETHCLLYPYSQREFILQQYKTVPWDNHDLWVSSAFGAGKLGVTARRLAIQLDGPSLITGEAWHHPKEWSAFGFVKQRVLFS
jgi:hypothetical protein